MHPLIVKQFVNPLSGGDDPVVLAVDLATADGSFPYDVDVKSVGARSDCIVPNTSPPETFGYASLGQLADGTHVVETFDNGGGTGTFEDLLFLRLREVRTRRANGSPVAQPVLSVVGTFGLGDRDTGKIQLFGDHVVVGPSRVRTAAVTLRPEPDPGVAP